MWSVHTLCPLAHGNINVESTHTLSIGPWIVRCNPIPDSLFSLLILILAKFAELLILQMLQMFLLLFSLSD